MARRKKTARRSSPSAGKHPKAAGNNARQVGLAAGIGRVPSGSDMTGSTTKPPFVGGPTT